MENIRLPGKISYAIVIDTLNGNRILLGDIIENEERFQDMLVHYFDDDRREVRLFIFEEDAEEIYRNWDQVLNQLIVLYPERLTPYL